MAVLTASFFCVTRPFAQTRTNAQQLVLGTSEDSLFSGAAKNKTVISGYGMVTYQRDMVQKKSMANLERAVLFVGHQFNNKISFFSELEIENGLVAGDGTSKGEISMEQAFLKFNLNRRQYLIAGLFTPRIGIINENHLPVNYNGVERPLVEQLIIPSTWRELGDGSYGTSSLLPITYSVAIVNGLNSDNFKHGDGLRSGMSEGSQATANNLAITAALQYPINDFRFQVSGYAGGTVGLSPRGADSLNLQSGTFGTPIYLGEGDVQWSHDAFSAKALGVVINYPKAGTINTAYATNVPKQMWGAYAELGYDWMFNSNSGKQFITFARVEKLDMNSKIPENGIIDGTLNQMNVIAGITYLPIPNIAIKADIRLLHTGAQNPNLIINPPPNQLPYKQNQQFINLGIGYAF